MMTTKKKNRTPKRGKKRAKRANKATLMNRLTAILVMIAVTIFLSGIVTPKSCNSVRKAEIPNGLEIPGKLHNRSEQIIHHEGYSVSYNEEWRLPNWVAYELTPSEVQGNEERSDSFVPDPMVTGVCPTTKDYVRSGYDRGHMAPAADMKWSPKAMEESFYMSNVCPQLHSMNSGIWLTYEERARKWATIDTIWIVCGPIVDKNPKRIGANKVAVPTYFYKTFLKRYQNTFTALAILCPNVAERKKMRDYVVSVDYIEQLTGINLYPALPDSIENKIEALTPFRHWNIK